MADAFEVIPPDTVIRPGERAVYRALAEGGGVVLHLDSAAYHGLTRVGAVIWELMGPGITFGALLGELQARLDDAPPELAADVTEFLRKLEERDLATLEPAG